MRERALPEGNTCPGGTSGESEIFFKEVGIGIRLGVPADAGVGATFTADSGARS